MAELVQNSATSIFFSPISFLLKTLTSLVFQEKKKKTGSCPSSRLLLSHSWQAQPEVSIEEVGRDTTHWESVKDLIYHQSESFQIFSPCFLMLLSLWWGIKDSSQGYGGPCESPLRRDWQNALQGVLELFINYKWYWGIEGGEKRAETTDSIIISARALLREIWISHN